MSYVDAHIPDTINGTEVEVSGKILLVRGERWVTLVPVDDDDERLWEFSLTSGQLLKTK